jgi:hypothetical protein
MTKKIKYVYVVSRSSAFEDCLNGLEAIFDTHEAAEAYIQFRIDMERNKHKQGHGGRWFNRSVHDEAIITCGCGDYYNLSIEKSKVHTKDDTINSRMK